MKIGDRIFVRGYIDEIRKDTVIVRNDGGYFGTIPSEVITGELPSAQPEVIRCKDCIYYDPPHVENNGVRYEYDEMPADAFDALGTGLVNAEYGINIGGRCCVDYYCKSYSDDKRVYVREDNYCGRAERRTDNANANA